MALSAFRGTVFKGRENTLVMTVQDEAADGTLTNTAWTNVTRMVLHLLSYNATTLVPVAIVATADTAVDSTLIDYSTDGQLTLKLGGLQTDASPAAEIPDGEYMFRVTGYEGAVDTQIVHEETHVARLTFVGGDSI